VSWRRAFRAVIIGTLVFIFGLIYVPQCQVQVYAENATPISLGVAAVITFFAYRF
jgi:hypothetical protein